MEGASQLVRDESDRAETQSGTHAPLLAGKRILIYSMHYAPEFAGVGRYTGEIGAELARRGAHVQAVTAPPHYPGWRVRSPWRNCYSLQTLSGVQIRRCPLYLARHVRGFTRILAPFTFMLTSLPIAVWKLFIHRPHVMILVEPTLMPAPLAALVAKLRGTRTVLHVQDLEIDGAFEVGHMRGSVLKRLGLLFEGLALRCVDRVITISETMRQRLVEKGVPAYKVGLIRNWVDLEKIAPLPEPNSYRAVLGIPDGKFVVQYSGNIGAKQALDLLCEAANRLRNHARIHFVIAGDGPERFRLEERFGRLPNLDFIDFQPEAALCAFLNMPDLHVIPQLATSADFALPSKLGGILASGRRVLIMASDGELSSFLKGAATIVPPGDADMLAKSILDLADHPVDESRAQRAELAQQLSSANALARISEEIGLQAERSRNKKGA